MLVVYCQLEYKGFWPWGETESDRQAGRETESEIAKGAVTHNKSSHQDEFSTVHTLSEGARQLLEHRGHVQKQSAYLTHLQLSGH